MATTDTDNPLLKYGLAALIGAVAAIVGVLIKAKIDAKQERRKRRFDTLERCAKDFEKAAAVFVALFARYAGYLTPPKGPNDEVQRLAEAALLTELWDQIAKLIGTEVTAALVSLHEIDSSLHLIGCVESSRFVEQYRHIATDLQTAIIHREDINKRKLPTAAEWQAWGKKLTDTRTAVFNQLRVDFDSF